MNMLEINGIPLWEADMSIAVAVMDILRKKEIRIINRQTYRRAAAIQGLKNRTYEDFRKLIPRILIEVNGETGTREVEELITMAEGRSNHGDYRKLLDAIWEVFSYEHNLFIADRKRELRKMTHEAIYGKT